MSSRNSTDTLQLRGEVKMGFVVGLVIGLAVGITIIIGFVKAENYRSKLRAELVSHHTHTLTIRFFQIRFQLDLSIFSGEHGGCFREDDGGGFKEASAC